MGRNSKMRHSLEDAKRRSELALTSDASAGKLFCVEIVIVYLSRYRHGHEANFVNTRFG